MLKLSAQQSNVFLPNALSVINIMDIERVFKFYKRLVTFLYMIGCRANILDWSGVHSY
jgi:hypothetical protein